MGRKKQQTEGSAATPAVPTPSVRVLYVSFNADSGIEFVGESLEELASNGVEEGQRVGIYTFESIGEFKNSPTIVNQRAQ